MRYYIDFNDGWTFEGEPVSLPHTWNAQDGQDGGNDYLRGTFVYARAFHRSDLVRAISKGVPGKKTALEVYLEVGAAAMTADVSLNGHPIDHHEGGFSLFRAELTPYLEENNLLRIAVDNGANDHVYPQKADFTFYGGLYRGVRLLVFAGQEDSKNDETVMCPHFQPGDHGTDGFSAQALVQKDQSAKVAFEGITAGEADAVRVRVDGDGAHGKWKYLTLLPENDNKVCREIQNSAEKDPARKTWKGEMRIAKPHLWDGIPDPYLYKVTAQVLHGEAVTDEVQETIGIRSFSVDPKRGFFLNGRSYPLIGVARHQDRRGVGNAVSHAQMEEDMDLIRGMGANMIRLAHYQHDPYFYDLCDRYGMIVWAEIPYITEHKDNPRACQNTAEQMTELILQNRQHPSIICWALSNEITVTGGPTPAIYENHKRLNDLCHRLDPSRLTAMAHAFLLDPDDPLVSLPDVSAYNLYYGWYLGTLQDNDAFFDAYHAKHPDRAIGLSEFGADALISYQTSTPKRGDDSEQYQCLYHEHMLKMWSERPYLWMMSVWNMFDFGADGRSDAGEPGVNHKGLVTFDRKTCKDAYFLYKAWLSREPFVHLCGRRYVNRAEEVTSVKVYSNQKEVTLLVDGKLFGTKKGSRVFSFEVPLSQNGGTEKTWHRIEVLAGDCRDGIDVCRVLEPDLSYQAPQAKVVNWFDTDEEIEREGYFSIHDSVASVKGNEKAGQIYHELTAPLEAKAAEAFGDVAKNVRISPEMQNRMDQMSVEDTLRQMGSLVTAEFMHRLNHALNQVRKHAVGE